MLSLISKTNNALSYTIIITCAAHSIGNLFLAIKQTFSKDPSMAFGANLQVHMVVLKPAENTILKQSNK